MSDWKLPGISDLYTNVLTYLSNRLNDAAQLFDSTTTTPTNQPVGTKRWNASTKKFEKWNGTAWVDMTDTYAISVDNAAKLGGKTAEELTADKNPLNNIATVANITNANSSSCSFNVSDSALLYIVYLPSGINANTFNVEFTNFPTTPNLVKTFYLMFRNGGDSFYYNFNTDIIDPSLDFGEVSSDYWNNNYSPDQIYNNNEIFEFIYVAGDSAEVGQAPLFSYRFYSSY